MDSEPEVGQEPHQKITSVVPEASLPSPEPTKRHSKRPPKDPPAKARSQWRLMGGAGGKIVKVSKKGEEEGERL